MRFTVTVALTLLVAQAVGTLTPSPIQARDSRSGNAVPALALRVSPNPAELGQKLTVAQPANTVDPLIFTAQGALWTLSAGGVRRALLPPGSGVAEAGDTAPQLSPDGRHILYSTLGAGGPMTIWMLDLSGGKPRRLLSAAAGSTLGKFCWSSDGQGVVFAIYNQGMPAGYRGAPIYSWTLSTLDLAGRQRHLVSRVAKDPPYIPEVLGWSRQAHQIYLQEGEDGGAIAYDVMGENSRILASYRTPLRPQTAMLSPDQTRVLIAVPPASYGQQGFFSMRRAAQPSRVVLTLHPARGRLLDFFTIWSADGRSLAYGTYPAASDPAMLETGVELRVATIASGTTRLLEQVRGINTHVVAWSRDGRAILIEQEVLQGNVDTSVFETIRPDGTGLRAINLSRSRQEMVVGWATPAGEDRCEIVSRALVQECLGSQPCCGSPKTVDAVWRSPQ